MGCGSLMLLAVGALREGHGLAILAQRQGHGFDYLF